jgi:stage III sporulation protein AD
MKVMAAAVAGAALGLVVKRNNPENSLLVAVALSVFAVYMSIDVMSSVLDFLRTVADAAGIPSAALAVVLKTAGISVVTKLIADICRDAGQAGAASGVEFMGAVTAVYLALPLFQTVLDMINSLLQ